jgi:hypothetical protein
MIKRMHGTAVAALLALLAATGCDSLLDVNPQDSTTVVYDFNTGAHGWVAALTDYAVGADEMMEFEHGVAKLPLPLDTTKRGYMISSMNRSDDAFTYIRRQLTGLAANTDYDVSWEVQIATNAPSGCVGAGGPPGEGVVLKVGASAAEPLPVDRNGEWRLSVDKGEQMEEGSAALILDDIANSSEDCHEPPYELKDFASAPRKLRVRTDDAGRVWLFSGTESGFESRTRIYFTSIRARLDRVL